MAAPGRFLGVRETDIIAIEAERRSSSGEGPIEMPLNAALLRGSLAALEPRADEMIRDFYETLFRKHPAIRPMFAGTDMVAQRKKFWETLEIIVQNLEAPDQLLSHVLLLGNSHVDYGVKHEHYAPVLDCLLEAMGRAAGKSWTPELAAEWRQAYEVVAGIMKKGHGLRGKK